MAPDDHLVDVVAFAFKHRFNSAVAQIANPTGEMQEACVLLGLRPEKDPLNSAGYQYMRANS
jgi:hypothetical protein